MPDGEPCEPSGTTNPLPQNPPYICVFLVVSVVFAIVFVQICYPSNLRRKKGLTDEFGVNNKLDKLQSRERRSCLIERGSQWRSSQPNLRNKNDEKSKTTARLTQRNIFKTIFRLARPAFFRFRCY